MLSNVQRDMPVFLNSFDALCTLGSAVEFRVCLENTHGRSGFTECKPDLDVSGTVNQAVVYTAF